jgi:L-2-hydroxycarboxylate dehydrogenase (NAD+)
MTFTYKYLLSFVTDLFQKTGCSVEDSQIIAEVLLKAELRGIPSHGLIRIPDYFNLWKTGRINVKPNVRIVHETPSTGVIDGDNAFGMISAGKSMQTAISKAMTAGTGWVSTRTSNHFGIAGYYAMMALEHQMIGICLTNANPLVAPTFSRDKLLGTNPIAIAIPAGKQPPFVADFATTPIARGKLEILARQNKKSPSGFVQDQYGNSSDDPNILRKGGAMLTLGGDREHGSHKGYCLAAVVDIFSALLSGANFGPFVPPSVAYLPVLENTGGLGTGHFFGAMRIDAFQTVNDFRKRMDEWIITFRNAASSEGQPQVLIPGDPERENERINMTSGIHVLPEIAGEISSLARDYDLQFEPDI